MDSNDSLETLRMLDSIIVKGARVHNLKNVSLEIKHDSLVVFTGLSGSGKSSLAFDTIHAEGQRRFMESLSSYSKQFLENLDKPDVDQIDGLPPTIAIDQKTSSSSPRSTVGTATEIYDYLRLLFARAGTPHCPSCKGAIERKSRHHITAEITKILKDASGKVLLLASMRGGDTVKLDALLEELEKLAVHAVRIDGTLYSLRELIIQKPLISKDTRLGVVIDTFERRGGMSENPGRIAQSIQRAMELGDGSLTLWLPPKEERVFTERLVCTHCNRVLEELEPRNFSFNNPSGACKTCAGLGVILSFDPDLLIVNKKLTIAQGAITPLNKLYTNSHHLLERIDEALRSVGCSIHTPIQDMTEVQLHALLNGTKEPSRKKKMAPTGEHYSGILPFLEEKYHSSESDYIKKELEECMRSSLCRECNGKRLSAQALAVTVTDRTIDSIVSMPIDGVIDFFSKLNESKQNPRHANEIKKITEPIIHEIIKRAQALKKVGLDYLVLDRGMHTLSGGEAQRVKLANHLSTSLVGVVYVLDEPSIGLHPRDTAQLIATLQEFKNLGNTVLVVEHDKQIIESADHVIDVGPRAGKQGGEIIASGTPKEIMKNSKSLTGRYLSNQCTITLPKRIRVKSDQWIEIVGARAFNLKNVTARIPLGKLVVVTGVSGSGKSTLIGDILSKALMKKFYRSKDIPGEHDTITGLEHIDKAILIDQGPIGRTPRSNPATYTNIFTAIRELYTDLPEAKIKGLTPGHFSFNVRGGRCETCQGEGMARIDMRFLSDVFVECRDCGGKRYTDEALEIHYEGLSISDVLDLTVDEALLIFTKVPNIHDKLKTLSDVGLGYIRLGQGSPTLSGGEAQRIKLAAELSRRSTGNTLTILDEPTTGLHFEDVKQLLNVLNQLVEKGNTVLMIEHNMDMIKNADWIIDMGPEGGAGGGSIVAQGTPAELARHTKSWTGKYLKDVL